ncbi:hypothetical protein Pcinc_022050 [Petrolisthes cinctipes]|uniref:Uncharacterized protein n=1 Tax=Petrolisthes cinctipes TaxID=88211 RepID=A0AAE1KE90_PETCI|nr:hypothetical protein Pcinc_022050 [Petrolisthes cinctipes]
MTPTSDDARGRVRPSPPATSPEDQQPLHRCSLVSRRHARVPRPLLECPRLSRPPLTFPAHTGQTKTNHEPTTAFVNIKKFQEKYAGCLYPWILFNMRGRTESYLAA